MDNKSLSDQLCDASATGDLETVLHLLENGAPVNGRNRFNRTPLQVVKWGCTPVVEALLQAGADVTVRDPVLDLTVMHDAARAGFRDSVRALLNYEADVNAVDQLGNLPLHLAAAEGNLEVVQLLVGLTGNPGAANGAGLSARQLAASKGKMETAQCIDQYLAQN
ncbi:cyclin-dependent kinase 4 inhibitor C [Stegastes partitus]|uniref:Cyclin dependent kinase inhibitor 2C n=1 Tax=Stegastes partitus TaxID=144197 RepID=A0A3B5AVT4_9TELE|nr:PREDICTED: cyclin-dependent kinase 4 inhibitor C [Stegastes partitus]XP_008297725.1 PREDICTED: cyclin-dependent kinase 4 inhibitor C [Stegastes partitus]